MNGNERRLPSRTARFGVFEANAATGELRREGRVVKLQDQPYRLLIYLLERPGEVVTREELHAALWPDGSFVDFEQGLNAAIKKVRFALRDSAENPRFVQTFPRKGYRFIAPVGWEEARSQPDPAVTVSSPGRARMWMLAVAVAAGITAGYWWFRWREPRGTAAVPVPLTSYPGVQYAAAFSPDGRQVAFAWDGGSGDNFDIYVKTRDSESPTRLTNDAAPDLSPAWSPDGQRIAFLRDLGNGRVAIMLIPAAGGFPVQIAAVWAPLAPQYRNLAFTPDGSWLITAGSGKEGSAVGIVLCPAETGACRPLTKPSGGYDINPALSPDGRSLAFLRGPLLATMDLYVVPLEGNWSAAGEARRLTAWNRFALSPAWVRDGSEIVMASGEYFKTRLWHIPVSGSGEPAVIAAAGDEAMLPAMAPDGSMAFSQRRKRVSIWSLDLRRAEQQSHLVRWPASSSRIDTHPRFSPDGGRVVFKSTRSGTDQIWIANADGSGARQLTAMTATFVDMPAWSSDGTKVLFRALQDGHFDFYTVSAAGGTPRFLMRGNPGDGAPKVSADGQWIYFHSKRSGEYQIWRMPAGGGSAVQLTRGGGMGGRDSPDGRTLYFVRYAGGDNASLWRMPAGGGEEARVIEGILGESFDVTGKGIYYAGACRPDGTCPLFFHAFAGGENTQLAASTLPGNNGLCVSPNGHTLLRAHIIEIGADIMVLEGSGK
ncbi:MAG: PD40 domain-containing protein [Bryobacterales bacterium]|nr:PD40 domain-containing protein [Bryobacterales bacterium]